jgi:hypothetical protein
VGVVGDVYADPAAEHVIGLEVIGPNGRRWYLPWAAANIEDGEVYAASPLVFMPIEQVDFYVEHGARLTHRSSDGVVVGGDGRLTRPTPQAIVSAVEGEGTGVE